MPSPSATEDVVLHHPCINVQTSVMPPGKGGYSWG
jgi:hypothetical protein